MRIRQDIRDQRNWEASLWKDYGGTDMIEDAEDDDGDTQEELGGLFHIRKPNGGSKYKADALDCSRFPVETPHNWKLKEVMNNIQDCFMTGKWEEDKEEAKILAEDDELFGDSEDLEAGDVHKESQIWMLRL
ncbi:Ribosome biogenesis protein BMS1 like protein [Fukomys damarensis]|uniref:Ribosome biogenesis protein BMS1 like protein n=1 Tax=Fukomys damarensis TaxID=885580 RepID=A0A091CX61_FUKDA|nr:Ribosome biogenesis protein BMS1 like protein [Fukomys damarensis]